LNKWLKLINKKSKHTVKNMKYILPLMIFLTWSCYAQNEESSVDMEQTDTAGHMVNALIKGHLFTHITRVDFKITVSNVNMVVVSSEGGTSSDISEASESFLSSWGMDKERKEKSFLDVLDKAIQEGCFRVFKGVVYDIRSAPGWLNFKNMKVVSIVENGIIVDPLPNVYSIKTLFVKNLGDSIGDTDYVSFLAMPDGSYSYKNLAGNIRIVRAFDAGRVCERSEIPARVLNGEISYAPLEGRNTSQENRLENLPDSDQLKGNGSGFFVSNDGYFITNDHVVKNARRIKLKIGGETIPADVIREDAHLDLALLKAEGQFKALAISSHDAELGKAVFTFGFPNINIQGLEPKYTDGKISSLSGFKDDPDDYQISVQVQPGNSGGALVDSATGNVTGVIVARISDSAFQNVNYAIKGSILRNFLSQSPDINFAPIENNSSKDIIQSVKQAVGLVLVY